MPWTSRTQQKCSRSPKCPRFGRIMNTQQFANKGLIICLKPKCYNRQMRNGASDQPRRRHSSGSLFFLGMRPYVSFSWTVKIIQGCLHNRGTRYVAIDLESVDWSQTPTQDDATAVWIAAACRSRVLLCELSLFHSSRLRL